MFTRFYDDPCRIEKYNQIATEPGRYMLDTPGNGAKPFYMEDPQIIPQKWAGNLWTHSTDIQSSLLGLDRTVNRDCLQTKGTEGRVFGPDPLQKEGRILGPNPREVPKGSECDRTPKPEIIARPIQYPTSRALTTDQPRATDPAWTARDLDQSYRMPLQHNPQANSRIFQPFQYDASSRIAEKDGFVRQSFCVPTDTNFYGLPSETMTNPGIHPNFSVSNQKI
jgi:hypothetical protein